MNTDWSSLFIFAFVSMLIGSVWGAVVLAMKWTKEIAPRILLGLLLFAFFCVAGTTAILANCVAGSGSPNFH